MRRRAMLAGAAATTLARTAAWAQAAAQTAAQSGTQGGAQTGAQPNAQAGVQAATPIRLGVLSDMSGPFADNNGPGSLFAAQLAVADHGGTAAGRPVEVRGGDHLDKPDVGAARARQWFQSDGVDVVIDVPVSSVALAVQQVARETGRMLLMSAPGATEISGALCAPTAIQWTYDTYALSGVAGRAVVERGGTTWFFITADYAFGHALEEDCGRVVAAAGGRVLGSARHPIGTSDFSALLLQAASSGAKVVAMANSGSDLQNAVKQAAEFGLQARGQQLVALNLDVANVDAIGLPIAGGMLAALPFYWAQSDASRAFARRFMDRIGRPPSYTQAGVYSVTLAYLRAVQAADTTDPTRVVAKMRATPVHDAFTAHGTLRADNLMVHDMLLAQVKTPAQSTGRWDLFDVLQTLPGDEVYPPLKDSRCPMVHAG